MKKLTMATILALLCNAGTAQAEVVGYAPNHRNKIYFYNKANAMVEINFKDQYGKERQEDVMPDYIVEIPYSTEKSQVIIFEKNDWTTLALHEIDKGEDASAAIHEILSSAK